MPATAVNSLFSWGGRPAAHLRSLPLHQNAWLVFKQTVLINADDVLWRRQNVAIAVLGNQSCEHLQSQTTWLELDFQIVLVTIDGSHSYFRPNKLH